MTARAEETVRDYYDALREGDPLESYFLADDSTVKFGIGEALFGYDEVAEALREQTETTDDWAVESHRLVVDDRGPVATVADEVTMAWTDLESDERREFETRWSATLLLADAEFGDADRAGLDDSASAGNDWLFASMHVSTADEL
ncbi:nuclear transport factor 2 family protein [Natrialba sp. INN-245]|uniref:nuclear transport factor 2 family protein n=1 Tax=Natrialba sp. INN-245 TaxID=2690967 RepID=UPI0013120247|nr:nuclear transport factor 2 family protein [Natrialba sp. INN-245]MWV40683.1 DUF3225 domain-containing protein [Natrialba sp. INN-245]